MNKGDILIWLIEKLQVLPLIKWFNAKNVNTGVLDNSTEIANIDDIMCDF